MRLLTLVNSVMRFKGVVFDDSFLTDAKRTLILQLRPHKRNRPVCSGCSSQGPVYDHLDPRLFEHVPLWGLSVKFEYVMRRVNCKYCGATVEKVPWSDGNQRVTNDFRHFLST